MIARLQSKERAISFVVQVSDGNGGTDTATIHVTVEQAMIHYIYLPLVLNNYVVAPDLIVTNINVDARAVQVTIQNTGNAPATEDFWVDVYINPAPVPNTVNQLWPDVASQGAVWGVSADIPAGGTLTLTTGDGFYFGERSSLTFPLAADTQVYAQVDSWNSDTTYGTVLENHEITGGTYNNITGITVSGTGASLQLAVVHPAGQPANLPPR